MGQRSLGRASLAAALLLLLQACISAPPAASNPNWAVLQTQLESLERWQLRGRVNVRYQGESHTPRIDWQQNVDDYRIRVWGTFNAGNTLIHGNEAGVSLESRGRTTRAATPEGLILRELGYELPVSSLNYWIKGLPAPDSLYELAFDELNRLSELTQDGWLIRYPDPRQYGALSLPRRIEASHGERDISLTFVGLNWTLD